jgi:hypothetical protein
LLGAKVTAWSAPDVILAAKEAVPSVLTRVPIFAFQLRPLVGALYAMQKPRPQQVPDFPFS